MGAFHFFLTPSDQGLPLSLPLTHPPHLLRENILKTAKALVEDTKLLVSGAASTPDKLAQAAQSSAATITQLAEVVKLGAASLGSDDPETQVGLGGPHVPPNSVHQASEEIKGKIGTLGVNTTYMKVCTVCRLGAR